MLSKTKGSVRCSRCIRSSDRNDVTLNSDGLCEKCEVFSLTSQTYKTISWEHFAKTLTEKYSENNARYDCLALYSGGKDSTYMLHYLSRIPDFRVIAVTIDFGFISPDTRRNIDIVLKNLAIDHIFFRPSWSVIKQLYKETVPIVGKLCSVCEGILTSQAYNLTMEMRIPCMAWGLPKQQFRTPPAWLLEIDVNYWNKIQDKFINRIHRIVGPNSEAYKEFLNMYVPNISSCNESLLPDLLFPFLALEYDVNEIENLCKELGWRRPLDVFGTSSNCYATHLHAYLSHETNPRDFLEDYLSNLVRQGFISRDRALSAVITNPDQEVAVEILQEIGVDICVDALAEKFVTEGKSILIT